MNPPFDLAIVGSGFAGSLLAMIARRLGRSVALLERERHPRFAIGESSTPLASLLIEELAQRYDLPALLPFTKWGAWQKHRPEVACGLKRGFTFYHHRFDQHWQPDNRRSNELLVAASPRDEIADTHWYRPDLDHALAQLAVQQGAELIEEATLDSIDLTAAGAEIRGRTGTKPLAIRARMVIDASGPRGFLARSLGLAEQSFASMPATRSLYSHFRDVRRWDASHHTRESPPYPVDDAALHHVFEGGWIWVLRFNNGITSAGVAATDALARELRFEDGADAWDRLLARLPSVREQFRNATACLPFRHAPRLSYRTSAVAGEGWALLPSAAGLVDPLLSTGFPLTLLGIERLARSLERDWNSARWQTSLAAYAATTLEELDLTAALIGALYRNMANFKTFSDLTLLYFAAASFSETARRLDRASMADGFLLGRHPVFGPALRRCVQAAGAGRATRSPGFLAPLVKDAIEPINVAGLGDPQRGNWYPALAEDLYAAAGKLNVKRPDIESMLLRAGFSQPPELAD